MARMRPKPMMIAPLIPVWGAVAFVGLQQVAGTRWEVPFLVLMAVLFLALFGYVATHVVKARRRRKHHRGGVGEGGRG